MPELPDLFARHLRIAPTTSRAALLLALLLPTVAACGSNGDEPARRPQSVRRVGIESAAIRPLERALLAPAIVEPVAAAEIGVKTQGRVVELLADAGDTVRRGQALARLSSLPVAFGRDEAQAAAGAAEAELTRARIDRDQKRRDLDRAHRVHAEGLVSSEALERAAAALAMAEATLENVSRRSAAGLASASAAGAQAAELNIVSPIDGQIARRLIEAGEVVGAGDPAFRVIDPRRLRAVAYIAEHELAWVAEGQKATVILPSLGETIPASVTAVVRELDPSTRLARVEIAFENPGSRIPSGIRADIRIVTERVPDAVAIPASAIVSREDGDHVFLVDGEKVKQTRVRVAFRDGAWAAVASGLAPGDRIVTRNLAGLRTGTTVAHLDDENPAAPESRALEGRDGGSRPTQGPAGGPGSTRTAPDAPRR